MARAKKWYVFSTLLAPSRHFILKLAFDTKAPTAANEKKKKKIQKKMKGKKSSKKKKN